MKILLPFALILLAYLFVRSLNNAREQLTPEQRTLLRRKTISLKIMLYSIPCMIALLTLTLIILAEKYEPNYFPTVAIFKVKIILWVVIGITMVLIYRMHYYRLKALGFPNSYLRALILYSLGLFVTLIGLSFINTSNMNEQQHEYFYWNGYWDPACSKCWPQPQTENNNHCTPSDCAIQGNYRCQPQQPPLSRANDPRIIRLIKSGQCKFVH